jgi:hypothetical protein
MAKGSPPKLSAGEHATWMVGAIVNQMIWGVQPVLTRWCVSVKIFSPKILNWLLFGSPGAEHAQAAPAPQHCSRCGRGRHLPHSSKHLPFCALFYALQDASPSRRGRYELANAVPAHFVPCEHGGFASIVRWLLRWISVALFCPHFLQCDCSLATPLYLLTRANELGLRARRMAVGTFVETTHCCWPSLSSLRS